MTTHIAMFIEGDESASCNNGNESPNVQDGQKREKSADEGEDRDEENEMCGYLNVQMYGNNGRPVSLSHC